MLVIDFDSSTVRVREAGAEREFPLASPEAFAAVSRAWLRCGWDTKYVYSFTWLGRPIIQLPDDMLRIQEVIYAVRPDVIIETGVAHGGSLVFYASLCKALDRGRGIGIDVEIRKQNRAALESILNLGAQVQFGGGMRSLDGIERAYGLGVRRVVLGTIAVENPDVVAEALTRFGAERIAVGIDARDGFVRVRGWKESSRISATELALQMQTVGLSTVIFTDVSRDGLGSGLNIAATKELADVSGLDVIASGGVHTIEDVRAVQEAGLAGVIIGRALYEGTIHLKDLDF